MVNDSKILTVSYGTFSCTLEGFDDPFSTMKDIAEYFRDLAAQDRYFGAEPPTPDTQMLQRIAEQNSRASVSAEMSDNAVTLRPSQAPLQAATAAPFVAPAPELDAAPAMAETVAETVETTPEVAAADASLNVAPEDIAETQEETAAWDVEQDLAEEDAVDEVTLEDMDTVMDTVAEDVAAVDSDDADVVADDFDIIEDAPVADHREDTPEIDAVTAEIFAEEDAEEDIAEEDFADDVAFDDAAAMDHDIPNLAAITAAADLNDGQDEVAHAHTPETQTDGASVADRLALIRQAVAEDDAEDSLGAFEQAYSEDEHADVLTQSAEDTIAAFLAGDEHMDAVAPLEDVSDDFDAPLVLAADDIVEADETDADDLAIAQALQDDHDVEDDLSDWDADSAHSDEEMLGDESYADVSEADEADAEIAAQEQDLEDAVAEDAAAAKIHDNTASVLVPMPLRAIVKRIRRGPEEVPSAPLDGALEHDAEAVATEVIASELGLKAAAGPEDEADVERLFEKTRDKFAGEETSRAHANISHLKAAVAARNADSDEMAKMAKPDDIDPYREDLANAVKPGRPRRVSKDGEIARTERPVSEPIVPAAPLVLVSEQRVDENGEPAPAVQPRRVRRAMDESFETDRETLAAAAAAAEDGSRVKTNHSEFKAFAEDAGVTDLVDILEAAAAYCQLERGLESFSRPKLLHLAQEVDTEFSREEGLRGFGQLLRSGTIKKIKRGSFELARTSRFIETVNNRAAG